MKAKNTGNTCQGKCFSSISQRPFLINKTSRLQHGKSKHLISECVVQALEIHTCPKPTQTHHFDLHYIYLKKRGPTHGSLHATHWKIVVFLSNVTGKSLQGLYMVLTSALHRQHSARREGNNE
jgi:hypothetical protein